MSPTDLVQLATQLVSEATAHGAVLRLFGSVAVYAHCDSIASHPTLQRDYNDLDFIAPRESWPALDPLFRSRGFEKTETPKGPIFTRDTLQAEIRDPFFSEHHQFSLADRLTVDPLTISVSDLVLFKLQRKRLGTKDEPDAIALLLDHRVTDTDQEDTISTARIAEVTARDFGFWDTVYDNTIELEKKLDRYLEPEEAQLVWRRIEQIQGELDRHAKSARWWSRAILSPKLPWYH